MNALKLEVENKQHWEDTYNRLIVKQNISQADKDLLWVAKEIERQNIIDELFNGTYEWSTPRKVEIAKHQTNKKRIVYVYSFKDRYVIGVLYRAFSEYFKDCMCDNCFSYKKNISTSHAIEYIRDNRKENFHYGVKIDIHAYFNSVSEERVTEVVNELFSGNIKKTLEKLLFNNKVKFNGKEIEEWKGLIPGCALGSFLANICLKDIDAYFNSLPCIYARYSDDIVILSDNKDQLQQYLDKLLTSIEEYGLTINPDKYTWFEPGDSIDYLGLELNDNGVIDISKHAKFKMKKQIHRWCRKGRMEIERDNQDFNTVASKIMRRLNNKNFKCFIYNEEQFGWCAYAFPRITTTETLKELDLYTKDCLRAMKTGKHNKANYKAMTEEEFHSLGWVSLVQLYWLFKKDFDYYCEIIELL